MRVSDWTHAQLNVIINICEAYDRTLGALGAILSDNRIIFSHHGSLSSIRALLTDPKVQQLSQDQFFVFIDMACDLDGYSVSTHTIKDALEQPEYVLCIFCNWSPGTIIFQDRYICTSCWNQIVTIGKK